MRVTIVAVALIGGTSSVLAEGGFTYAGSPKYAAFYRHSAAAIGVDARHDPRRWMDAQAGLLRPVLPLRPGGIALRAP
jgi:hypothetical protein